MLYLPKRRGDIGPQALSIMADVFTVLVMGAFMGVITFWTMFALGLI